MLKFDFNLLWTVVNLIIFFLIMRFLLLKPIKKVITQRQELIDKQFKDAENTMDSANETLEKYEAKLANAEDEAKEIIDDARSKAKVEYNKIIDKASDDVEKMKVDAQKRIDQETEASRLAVKEEIAKLALETAQKVVGENINAQTDSDIYNKFLNESRD